MPDHGMVAFCTRPGCDWVATTDGETVATFSTLGALRAIDQHLHDVHGEAARTARKPRTMAEAFIAGDPELQAALEADLAAFVPAP